MRKAILVLALAAGTAGQTSSGLTAIQLQGTGEWVSTSATNICSRNQVTTVRQTPSTLVVANGASGTAPQTVRLVSATAPRTRIFTAPITVSITGGQGVASLVEFWAVPTTTSVSLYVTNNSGSTMSCSPTCNVITSTSGSAATARAGIRLATWTVSAGNPVTWDTSGGTLYNTNFDCNLQSISLFNNSVSVVSVTMTTASGLSLPWVPNPLTLDPGSIFSMSAPATGSTAGPTTGIYHEGGLNVSASVGGVIAMRFNTILYVPSGQ